MAARRRDLLLVLGAMAVAFAAPSVIRRSLRTEFDFAPIPGLPGFRKLNGQAASFPGSIALIGLDAMSDAETARMSRLRANPCPALFGPGAVSGDRVPVAVFSDTNCPNCPKTMALLNQMAQARADMRLVLHEYPILGPRSEWAARLALAAAMQGRHQAAHDHLLHNPSPPGPAGVKRLAAALGLDADRLTRDAAGTQVSAQLARSRALAAAIGAQGTPTLVVGRTRVTGGLPYGQLSRLIDLERREPGLPCQAIAETRQN